MEAHKNGESLLRSVAVAAAVAASIGGLAFGYGTLTGRVNDSTRRIEVLEGMCSIILRIDKSVALLSDGQARLEKAIEDLRRK